jgi:hypothetical protein
LSAVLCQAKELTSLQFLRHLQAHEFAIA